MRLKTTKTANTTNYYAIIDIKTKEGKRSTKIYKRLCNEQEISKISNGEPPIEWAKKQVAELKKAYEEKTLKIIAEYSQNELIEKDTQNLFNGGYLFLQDIYYDLGLDKICKSISEKYRIKYDLNSILSNLIYTRFIEPSSKLSAFETTKTLLEQPNFQLQNIYRALEVISSETENIEVEIFFKYNEKNKEFNIELPNDNNWNFLDSIFEDSKKKPFKVCKTIKMFTKHFPNLLKYQDY